MTLLGSLVEPSHDHQATCFTRFVAHRGANNEAPGNSLPHYPENSLLALREAYAHGVTYVECDVHMTRDRKIVVIHDSTLRRTGCYNPAIATSLSPEAFEAIRDQEISTLNYSDTLSQVDIGSYADYLDPDLCRGTKIPLLEEFLSELQGHPERKLLIDIKAGSSLEIVDKVKEVIDECSQGNLINADQLIIVSFDLSILKGAKKLLPEYKALLLLITTPDVNEATPHPTIPDEYVGLYHRVKDRADLEHIIDVAKRAKLDALGLEYDPALVDAGSVQRLKDHDLLCYIWNYPKDDHPKIAMGLLDLDVDLIATNQPQVMLHHRLCD